MTTADTLRKSDPVAGEPPAEAAVPPRPRPARDPFFDNAKFLLVVLVVIGHNWYPLIGESRAVKAAYMVVYAFHMPAFILLSGYFSRNFEARPDQVRRLVKSVLLPYLIFQAIYLAVIDRINGTHFTMNWNYPSYLCWFLVALFAWRLTTPLWKALPQPIVIAVLVSIVAGLMNVGVDFASARILEFLPWFVAGLSMKPEHFQWLRRSSVRRWSAAAVLVALPVAYLLAPAANVKWLDNEWGTETLGVGDAEYVGIRLALLLASTVMVISVLALVPRRKLWFTALGAVTMYPYLLHGLVVQAGEWAGVHNAVAKDGPLAIVSLTAGAVLLALVLASPPVRKLAHWAVEPSVPRPPSPRALLGR
ncbi:acyltransferase family protein [Streptomyces sp. PTM05]|uniref:Acyltransferase family protein n=1 Tax=Streptantibioticus parmotrematis TaxID=2873249 RepID=A0ABS7QZA2_9ACTN|nr:acyltransferase family protein [Streptantibioticus parmotrematis]MBY8888016.1 acyltransferase family protein [Streptantibioticus parmotrematis]